MPSRTRRPAVVAALFALLVLSPMAAQADPDDLTDEERQRIEDAGELTAEERAAIERSDELTAAEEARIAEARAAIDRTEARIDEVEGEIAATEDELAGLQVELEQASRELRRAKDVAFAAEQAADTAQAELDQVLGELSDARAERSVNTEKVRSMARDTFMYGPGSSNEMMTIVDGLNSEGGPSDIARSTAALDVVLRDRAAIMEDSQRLVATTAQLREEAGLLEEATSERFADADAARQRAAELHASVFDLVEETDAALTRQNDLRRELARERATAEQQAEQARRDAEAAAEEREAQARADALAAAEARADEARAEAEAAAADRAAEARRAAEEAREAAEEARREAEEAERRAAEEAAEREAEEEAAREAEEASSSSSSSSSVSRSSSGGGLETVGGITVSSEIADELEDLLEAALADGIALGGSGYRSPDTTVALRIANGCPDVYDSPASSCDIPTARPGTSMHEQGLAVDFTYNGQTLCYPYSASSCSGNAAFDWLRSNASSYGLYNLPDEAWHWSTNGN